MTLIQQLFKAITDPRAAINYIIVKSGLRALECLVTGLYFDYRHKVETEVLVPRALLRANEADALAHAFEHRPSPIAYLKIAFAHLGVDQTKNVHFIDAGCGFGRACFYVLTNPKFQFSKITGFDFDKRLIGHAKRNLESFRLQNNAQQKDSANIEFLVANAQTFSIPHMSTCIYMCNPFDEKILKDFLKHNEECLRQFPVTIVYANDYYRNLIEEFGFVTMYRHRFYRISIMSNGIPLR